MHRRVWILEYSRLYNIGLLKVISSSLILKLTRFHKVATCLSCEDIINNHLIAKLQ